MGFTGQCLCGAIKYESKLSVGDNENLGHCHCTQCRRSTGSLVFTAADYRKKDVTFITQGNDRRNFSLENPPPGMKLYESTKGFYRGFCRECGSSMIWHSAKYHPDRVDILVGTIDNVRDSDIKIRSHVFISNEIPGIEIGPRNVPMYEQSSPDSAITAANADK